MSSTNGHKPSTKGKCANKPRDLTLKQTKWLEVYLQTGNATEAARQAGYSGDDDVLSQVGWQNIRKYQLQQRIAERVADSGVAANEVIGTLAAQMRCDVTEILTENGHLDVAVLRERRLGHLIRKIKTRRYIERIGDDAEPVEVTEVELHNSQTAAVQLCKILGIEKQPGENPNDLTARAEALCVEFEKKFNVGRPEAVEFLGRDFPEVRELGKIG